MSLLKYIKKNRDKILITSAVAVLVFFIYKEFIKKETEEGNSKEEVKSNTKKTLSSGVILSIPDTKYKKYNLVIIFGGMYYANPEWMYKQIPSEGLYKNILVIAPYTMNYETAKSIFEPEIKDLKIDSISVMGFSAGALQVQKNYSPSWKVAGLIDPSTRTEYLNLPFSSNVKMVYNDANWGGKLAGIGTVQTKLEPKIKEKNGYAEKVSIAHENIPKYFFDKFLNK